MLSSLAVSGYRSLRDIVIPLERLNLVTGPNGSGKSNLYRALRLLAETAQGRVIPSLAREGGLQSTLWAGPESFSRSVLRANIPCRAPVGKRPVSLRLGFAGDEFGYSIELGLPPPESRSAFHHDPEIKRECLWSGEVLRPSTMLVDRRGPLVKARSDDGDWTIVSNESLDLRQHDDALRRSAEHAGDADAARAHPRLALLRPAADGCRRARTAAADRHAHARPRSRWRRPGCRAPDHRRDRRRGGAQPIESRMRSQAPAWT